MTVRVVPAIRITSVPLKATAWPKSTWLRPPWFADPDL
jgi:hypothetical protein